MTFSLNADAWHAAHWVSSLATAHALPPSLLLVHPSSVDEVLDASLLVEISTIGTFFLTLFSQLAVTTEIVKHAFLISVFVLSAGASTAKHVSA